MIYAQYFLVLLHCLSRSLYLFDSKVDAEINQKNMQKIRALVTSGEEQYSATRHTLENV